MTISTAELLGLARLAELNLPPEDLPDLAAQLDRIVTFVSQLPDLTDSVPVPNQPATSPLRPDQVLPPDLVRGPETFAPEFVDGFFVVPRLGALDDA